MNAAVRAELRKLRATRSLVALLVVGAALAAVATAALLWVGKPSEIADRLSEHGPLRFGPSNYGLLLALFGVRLVADEVQHRTLAATFLRTPNRSTVLAAKVVVAAGASLLFCIVVDLLVLSVTSAGLALRDLDMTYDIGATASVLGRVALATTLFTALGVVVGAWIRNRTVALVAVLVWLALAEDLVAAILRDPPFLPGRAMQDLVSATGHPSAVSAAAVLFGLLIAITTAAVLRMRRDVA